VTPTLPAFTLPDTDGTPTPVIDAGAPASVVVFTCNHCPYALAWHARINAVAGDYAARGVQVVQVNPNDAERYPRDSLDAMRERVSRGDFATPYLRDEQQELARAWDARVTPDVFVVGPDGALLYRGAPDGDHGDESQDAGWLREALDDVLAGRPVRVPATEPKGCSVKWRS
jgi:peroxiredoxin